MLTQQLAHESWPLTNMTEKREVFVRRTNVGICLDFTYISLNHAHLHPSNTSFSHYKLKCCVLFQALTTTTSKLLISTSRDRRTFWPPGSSRSVTIGWSVAIADLQNDSTEQVAEVWRLRSVQYNLCGVRKVVSLSILDTVKWKCWSCYNKFGVILGLTGVVGGVNA